MFTRIAVLALAAASIFSSAFAAPIARADPASEMLSLISGLKSTIKSDMASISDPETLVTTVVANIKGTTAQVKNLSVSADIAGVGLSLQLSLPTLLSTIVALIKNLESSPISTTEALVTELTSVVGTLISTIVGLLPKVLGPIVASIVGIVQGLLGGVLGGPLLVVLKGFGF
ncbi:hypothetical protein DL93DRAFT_2154688 [Clavulina sp. PMI_390]|nr:hypothetical protein DL93DRAFT_2154688 [Clavulina sp. PMI_390]